MKGKTYPHYAVGGGYCFFVTLDPEMITSTRAHATQTHNENDFPFHALTPEGQPSN